MAELPGEIIFLTLFVFPIFSSILSLVYHISYFPLWMEIFLGKHR